MSRRKLYLNLIKPIFDWIIAMVLVILIMPLMLLITLFLLFHFGKSPFFVQKRVGKDGKIFDLVKFRSMRFDDDDSSLTKVGRFIRRISLDELPQLWNVLRNEMSLVGPRPLLVEYLPFYNEKEKLRHKIKPGITGWTQVNGRNSIDWGKRMELDVYYAQNASFLLDFRIVLKTFFQFFRNAEFESAEGRDYKFSDYAAKR